MKNRASALSLSIAACLNLASIAYAQDADNTKRNSDQYSYGQPTAENQSNNKDSVKRTARLRRAIMREKGLSTNAQNVKIIDEHGFITLRGPVNDAREKGVIDDLARRCCRNGYRNEIEVKTEK